MKDIHALHFALSELDFHQTLTVVQGKWAEKAELTTFSQYFSKYWLNHRVWRWQCFQTPSGYAATNNPCETFNAALKRGVTMRRKLKVGALIPQLLLLYSNERMVSRPFSTICKPDARLVRRVGAMARANLLSLHSTSKSSIAFLLSDSTVDEQQDVMRVLSRLSPRVFDETRRRTLEDLPVSSKVNKLTANMELRGMPTSGWAVDMLTPSCPCKFWFKYGCCIHVLYALETSGSMDVMGRETLVNRARTRRGRLEKLVKL
ncbi:hypothetical protein L916_12628 [Phytophthora nicotianae]|nr:hypothetical protein L916_12628 [Phytophthora nicotianae]